MKATICVLHRSWDKCTGTPGNSLSYRETACLDNCAKRFMETTQLIMQRFQQKAGRSDGGY